MFKTETDRTKPSKPIQKSKTEKKKLIKLVFFGFYFHKPINSVRLGFRLVISKPNQTCIIKILFYPYYFVRWTKYPPQLTLTTLIRFCILAPQNSPFPLSWSPINPFSSCSCDAPSTSPSFVCELQCPSQPFFLPVQVVIPHCFAIPVFFFPSLVSLIIVGLPINGSGGTCLAAVVAHPSLQWRHIPHSSDNTPSHCGGSRWSNVRYKAITSNLQNTGQGLASCLYLLLYIFNDLNIALCIL